MLRDTKNRIDDIKNIKNPHIMLMGLITETFTSLVCGSQGYFKVLNELLENYTVCIDEKIYDANNLGILNRQLSLNHSKMLESIINKVIL